MVSKLFRLSAHLIFEHRLWERHKSHLSRLIGATSTQRIRLVRHAAAVNCLSVHPVTLVVVHLRDGRVDRDLVKIRPAQAR